MQTRILKRITAAACSLFIALAGVQAINTDNITGSVIIAGAENAAVQRNTLVGATITLTGEIGVNFYLDVQDKAAFDTVVLSGPDGRKTIAASKLVPETSGEHAGLCKLTYLVDPTELDDTVSICLKKCGNNVSLYNSEGAAYNAEGVEYSVRKYIETVQNDENAGSDLSALVNALDLYGSYSRVQFKAADDPETDSVLADVDAAKLEKYKFSRTGELPKGVYTLGATLLLDSKTSFRIYFNKDPGAAEIDGEAASVMKKDGRYYIEVPDIAAADLDKTHQAVVGSSTMTFSALSYAYSALENSSDTSRNLVKLVKALYAYNFAANMYFEASSGAAPTLSENDFELTYTGSDDYADNYSFSYGDETFTAHYTPYLGGDWKIVDSYKITNRADMIIICEALLKESKVCGCITHYRTAKDMADEWEIHNQGYVVAKNYGMASAVDRLKDVDLDKKDQGKTFDEFLAEFLGRQ